MGNEWKKVIRQLILNNVKEPRGCEATHMALGRSNSALSSLVFTLYNRGKALKYKEMTVESCTTVKISL